MTAGEEAAETEPTPPRRPTPGSGGGANTAPTPEAGGSRYRLERELGRGGQGVVYLAEDLRLRRKVALKVLTGFAAGSEALVSRFRREAEIASRLDHPGICRVLDAGVEDGTPYIAMSYVEGLPLSTILGRLRTPTLAESDALEIAFPSGEDAVAAPPPAAAPDPASSARLPDAAATARFLRLIEETARALHAAHESGVVHRDVKPGNIMVTAQDAPVVLDFGLARLDDALGDALTRTGDVLGTPAYMSPEQLTGRRVALDRRTDVYSLGVTLYECLALRRPFEAPTRQALFQAIVTQEPPSLRRLNRAVSADLAAVVGVALEKEPDRRYQTALDFAEDLRRVRASEPVLARPPGPLGRLQRWARRSPAQAALLAVVLVALPVVGALVAAYVHSRPELERARLERIDAEREVILAEAAYELSEGAPAAALAAYDRAAAMEGVSPDAIVGRALAHLRLGDPAAALVALANPAAEQAGPHGARLLRADALRALRREVEAEALAKTAPRPTTAFDHALLALREVQAGDATGALEPFRAGLRHAATAIFLSPRLRLSHFTLYAHAAGHTADATACRRAADALRRHWPDEPLAIFWAAYALDMAGPPTRAEAAALYRESIRRAPNDAGPHLNLGLILFNSGKLEEAEREYREAIRCAPRYAEAHRLLGNLLEGVGRNEEAIAAYRTAIAYRPDDPGSRGNLAVVLDRVGKRDEAIEILRRLVDQFPEKHVDRRNLGVMLMDAGEHAAAEKELLHVAAAVPADDEVRLALVNLRLSRNRYAEAESYAREAVRIAPTRADCHQTLGYTLALQKRWAESVAPYAEALRLKPEDPILPVGLAQALRASKRPDDALDVLREAARKRPQDWKILVEYGVAAAGRGRPEEALRVLRAAEALRPDEPNTRINLGLVWTELGRCEEAVAAFRAGHERGLRNPKWDRPSAAWLENAEKTLEDDRRRDEALRARRAANDPPTDGGAAGDAARRWIRLGEPELGVAWCVAAFAADEDEGLAWKDRRYFRAACAAAAALPRAKEEDAAILRAHARAWLVLETSRYSEALAEKTVPPDEIVRGLAAYDDASLLTPFRGDGIAALPADERASWEAWAKEVARLRDAARAAFLAGG